MDFRNLVLGQLTSLTTTNMKPVMRYGWGAVVPRRQGVCVKGRAAELVTYCIANIDRTIAVEPTSNGEYPCFIVNDLSKDERFSELPFVAEAPHLRFYAGVPLITKRGIPIGSLFVVDDQVGQGWSRDKIHFMGTMAKTISE